MQSLLERIKAGTLWDFHGGIHPPENKEQSSLTPVVDAGLPPQLIIPVRQHAGPAGDLLVRVGDRVKKGQPLTRHEKGRIVPVHASTSGTITAIGHHTVAHPSGLDDLCITLTPDGEDAWGERKGQADYWNLERGELLERIQQAGIAGLGGAVFPTHSKLDGRGQLTEILIVNGLECEPYITTDDRLMQEYADEIMDGIRVLKHLLKPKLTLIGVEDNKPAAIGELTRHATDEDVLVKTVPTKYPSGGAKQTIELLTGRQVPKGGRAVDMGIMVLNVATVFAIKRAIIDGEPLISRIVTLTGDAFKKPGNAWVLLGTPVRWLLQRFELQPEADQRVIMGGPMMGFTLPHAMVPVVKATNCLLSPTRAELPPPGPEQACIRCSACADACPANLLPQELYWYSRAKEYDKAEGLNLFDCIECGACAWVCPSEIPLVQYYKIAKDDIREARAEAEKAERAKQRFEAKQARFEREKAAREARHAEAAAQRRQAMTAAGGEDPVAAALARLKAKQEAPITAVAATAEGVPDNSAVIAAREARKREAEARRAAKALDTTAAEPGDATATTEADPKKAAIAAALARAKAKKAAQSGDAEAAQATPADATASTSAAAQSDPKKAAIAAAIARAKAKKAQAGSEADATEPGADSSAATAEPTGAGDDPKKAAIAAAIARAKAKKAAAQAQGDTAVSEGEEAVAAAPAVVSQPDAAEADPKKAAIAAAIARAKAKKAAAQAQGDTAVSEGEEAVAAAPTAVSQPDAAEADPKKAAIAAAIARAKAKKAAAQAQSDTAVSEGEEAVAAAPATVPQPGAADADPKKAAIAAAIARAKAKKAAAQAQGDAAVSEGEAAVAATPAAVPQPDAADTDPKKAAIAAAVARAKARKLAAEAAAQASPSPSTDKSH